MPPNPITMIFEETEVGRTLSPKKKRKTPIEDIFEEEGPDERSVQTVRPSSASDVQSALETALTEGAKPVRKAITVANRYLPLEEAVEVVTELFQRPFYSGTRFVTEIQKTKDVEQAVEGALAELLSARTAREHREGKPEPVGWLAPGVRIEKPQTAEAFRAIGVKEEEVPIPVPVGVPFLGGKTFRPTTPELLGLTTEIAVPLDLGIGKVVKAGRATKAMKATKAAQLEAALKQVQAEKPLRDVRESARFGGEARRLRMEVEADVQARRVADAQARADEARRVAEEFQRRQRSAQAGGITEREAMITAEREQAERVTRAKGRLEEQNLARALEEQHTHTTDIRFQIDDTINEIDRLLASIHNRQQQIAAQRVSEVGQIELRQAITKESDQIDHLLAVIHQQQAVTRRTAPLTIPQMQVVAEAKQVVRQGGELPPLRTEPPSVEYSPVEQRAQEAMASLEDLPPAGTVLPLNKFPTFGKPSQYMGRQNIPVHAEGAVLLNVDLRKKLDGWEVVNTYRINEMGQKGEEIWGSGLSLKDAKQLIIDRLHEARDMLGNGRFVFGEARRPPELEEAMNVIRRSEEQVKKEQLEKPAYGSRNVLITSDAYDAAKVRLRERGGQLTTGVDPSWLADVTIVGAYHFEAGLREFGAWSTRLLQDFSADTQRVLRPHLQRIFDDIQARQTGQATTTPLLTGPTVPPSFAPLLSPGGAPVPPPPILPPGQATQTILGRIRRGGPGRPPFSLRRTLENAYTDVINDLHYINKATRDMTRTGGIAAEHDPSILAQLTRGTLGKSESFLKDGPFDPNTFERLPNTQSFEDIVNMIPDIDQGSAYLTSRRVLEFEQRGFTPEQIGFDPAVARQSFAELDTPQMRQFAEAIDRYQEGSLQYLVKQGMVSDEGATVMREANHAYVPFYRILDETTEDGLQAFGRKFADLPAAVRQFKGADLAIADPLESIIKNTFAFISLADRNATAKAMVDLAEATQGGDRWLTRVRGTAPQFVSKKDNILWVFENGKRAFFNVKDDGLYKGLLALDRGHVDFLTRLFSIPAQVLRAGVTLTPEFAIRNPWRDAITAVIQWGSQRPGALLHFPTDWLSSIGHILSDNVGEGDELMRLWRASGSEQAFLAAMDMSRQGSATRAITMMHAGPLEKAGLIIRHPIETLRAISGISEEVTRLAVFKGALREHGRTPSGIRRAAVASRSASVDFSIAGAKTQAIRSLVAFWNPALQGMRAMTKTFMEHPGRASLLVGGGITLPSVLLYMANRQDGRYTEIPQWQRDIFWIVPEGFVSRQEWAQMTPQQKSVFNSQHTIWRIPKPFEYGMVFGSLPERFLEFVDGTRPDLLDNLWRTLGTGVNLTPVPTSLVPVLEILMNKSTFTGRPIVPERLKRLLSQEHVQPGTSELAKRLGQWTDTSPLQVEHVLTGYGGGMARLGTQAINPFLKRAGAPPPPQGTMSDVPGLRSIVVRSPVASDAVDRFYQQWEQVEKQYNTLNAMKKRNLVPLPSTLGDHPHRVEARYHIFHDAAERMSVLREKAREIQQSRTIPPKWKRFQLDSLTYEANKIAEDILREERIQFHRKNP